MKKHRVVTLLLLPGALALLFIGCSSQGGAPAATNAAPSPEPTKEQKAEGKGPKDAEFDAELGDDSQEDRIAARKAVFDFVSAKGGSCKGVALRSVNGNIYVARVDAPGDASLDSPLIVQRFVTEAGDTYWKVERLRPILWQTVARPRPAGGGEQDDEK